MNEPPRPYSTDDLNATSNESNVGLPKRREWDELMGLDDIDVEDMEMIEEDSKEEDMAKKVEWKRCSDCGEMSEEAFGAAILFAYEKGKEDAEALDVEEITEIGAESLAMRIILNLKSEEQEHE